MNNQNNKNDKSEKLSTLLLSPRGNRWSEISSLQSKYLAVSQLNNNIDS